MAPHLPCGASSFYFQDLLAVRTDLLHHDSRRMRLLPALTAIIASLLIPLGVAGQTTRPTPRATYAVTARVQSAVDDEIEGISYLRVRLTVVSVSSKATVDGAPTLGAGTTLSAIVRAAEDRAVLKSVNPSLTLGLLLGWYDEGTYEVMGVTKPPSPPSAEPVATPTSIAGSFTGPLVLLTSLVVLGALGILYFRARGKPS